MSRRKIKPEGKRRPKKVRGHKQHRNVQHNQRLHTQRQLQQAAYILGLTKVDRETGEKYTLARLTLKENGDIEEYREGLSVAVQEVEATHPAQAEAIRAYVQKWVDEERVIAVPLQKGAKPGCRVYQGENARVVVIRQDDPEVM